MVTHKSLKEVPVVPLPYDAENKFLSKSEFVAKNNRRKEIEAKTKAYADGLRAEKEPNKESVEKVEVEKNEEPVKEAQKPVRKYVKKSVG